MFKHKIHNIIIEISAHALTNRTIKLSTLILPLLKRDALTKFEIKYCKSSDRNSELKKTALNCNSLEFHKKYYVI